MGKSDGAKMTVVDYYMSVHFAICHGPVDHMLRIVIKEKEAWSGKKTGNGPVIFFKTDLFGGRKKEGGAAGNVEWFDGNSEQLMSLSVSSRFRRLPEEMPAYRGIATAFFSGGIPIPFGGATAAWPPFQKFFNMPGFDLSGKSYGFQDIPVDRYGGFYWGSNNPYLPETWIKVSRSPKTSLPSHLATIENLVPEATIGLPKDPDEPKEDDEDDDEPPYVPDAENEDPLNGYYIGSLPTEENFIRTKYGWRGTPQDVLDDPVFERRLFDVDNRDKLKIGGLVYRSYGFDANPAHIIMECMTDNVWGMSAPGSMFDFASFTKAAETLYAEKFGLSLLWSQQTTIEAMVTEILDHIQGTLYLSPRTGLFTLTLLRGDYDLDTLRVLTPDNGDLKSFQRKAWGETINEVVVTWTNPENEKDSTVTLQDLANIGIQNGIVSEGRNYYGIRNAALAMKVAARDLRSASAPLASLEAELDRSAWDIVPGEVVRVQWPEEGIAGAVYRIMDVDYGRIGASTIRVKLIEDIFSLPTVGYRILGPAVPINQDGMPEPLSHLTLMTPPPQVAGRFGVSASAAYPDAAVIILGAVENAAVEGFELRGDAIAPDGSSTPVLLGEKSVTTFCRLPQGLPLEFESKIAALSGVTRSGGDPEAGGLFIIGNSEGEHEIGMFTAYSEATGYTFKRGMLDTVPRAWPPNTPAWVIQFGQFDAFDTALRAAGQEVDYSIVTKTANGALPEADAQDVSFTPSDRLWRPARPANCKLGGQPIFYKPASVPTTIPATWANRNRTQEDTVFRAWTEGSVSPEPGQTTTIRVIDVDGLVVAEHKGLTGTSFDLPTSGLSGLLEVRFLAEKDGLESFQAFAVNLELPYQTGYGKSYGVSYGV